MSRSSPARRKAAVSSRKLRVEMTYLRAQGRVTLGPVGQQAQHPDTERGDSQQRNDRHPHLERVALTRLRVDRRLTPFRRRDRRLRRSAVRRRLESGSGRQLSLCCHVKPAAAAIRVSRRLGPAPRTDKRVLIGSGSVTVRICRELLSRALDRPRVPIRLLLTNGG